MASRDGGWGENWSGAQHAGAAPSFHQVLQRPTLVDDRGDWGAALPEMRV